MYFFKASELSSENDPPPGFCPSTSGEGLPNPTPEEVAASQIAALKQWIAKCSHASAFEIWLGNARDDNFFETAAGIVPIDIRLWFAGGGPIEASSEW